MLDFFPVCITRSPQRASERSRSDDYEACIQLETVLSVTLREWFAAQDRIGETAPYEVRLRKFLLQMGFAFAPPRRPGRFEHELRRRPSLLSAG